MDIVRYIIEIFYCANDESNIKRAKCFSYTLSCLLFID